MHDDFFGLRLPSTDPDFLRGVEVGFMWCAVYDFAAGDGEMVLICMHESNAYMIMVMAERIGMPYHTHPACRVDHVHAVFTRESN